MGFLAPLLATTLLVAGASAEGCCERAKLAGVYEDLDDLADEDCCRLVAPVGATALTEQLNCTMLPTYTCFVNPKGKIKSVSGVGQNPGECCAACQAHAAVCSQPNAHSKAWWPARPELRCGNNPGCNIWVFCPEKQCFAFDIHARAQGVKPWRTSLVAQATRSLAAQQPHAPCARRRLPAPCLPHVSSLL